MSDVIKILHADFKSTLRNIFSGYLIIAVLLVYISLAETMAVNVGPVLLLGQMIMLFIICNYDITINFPIYIGMNCTRKHLLIATYIRWMCLFVAVTVITALACLLFEPELLIRKFFIIQIFSLFFMLGINLIANIIMNYNRVVGTLFAGSGTAFIGCAFLIGSFIDNSDVTIVINGIPNVYFEIFSCVSIITFLIGTAMQILFMRKYAVR